VHALRGVRSSRRRVYADRAGLVRILGISHPDQVLFYAPIPPCITNVLAPLSTTSDALRIGVPRLALALNRLAKPLKGPTDTRATAQYDRATPINITDVVRSSVAVYTRKSVPGIRYTSLPPLRYSSSCPCCSEDKLSSVGSPISTDDR